LVPNAFIPRLDVERGSIREGVSEKSLSRAAFDEGGSDAFESGSFVDAEISPKICDAIEARFPRLLSVGNFELEA
jgi:hypothetical protein